MPANVYYDNDADLGLIADKKVAILGLRLAGARARVEPEGLRHRRVRRPARGLEVEGEGRSRGAAVLPTAEAVREADIVMVLLPDTEQKKVYEADIAPNLVDGELARVRARLQHPLRARSRRPPVSTCG